MIALMPNRIRPSENLLNHNQLSFGFVIVQIIADIMFVSPIISKNK